MKVRQHPYFFEWFVGFAEKVWPAFAETFCILLLVVSLFALHPTLYSEKEKELTPLRPKFIYSLRFAVDRGTRDSTGYNPWEEREHAHPREQIYIRKELATTKYCPTKVFCLPRGAFFFRRLGRRAFSSLMCPPWLDRDGSLVDEQSRSASSESHSPDGEAACLERAPAGISHSIRVIECY